MTKPISLFQDSLHVVWITRDELDQLIEFTLDPLVIKPQGNQFKRLFSISGIVFIIMAFIMGLMFIFTCCFGYHPDNQRKFDNYKKIRDQR